MTDLTTGKRLGKFSKLTAWWSIWFDFVLNKQTTFDWFKWMLPTLFYLINIDITNDSIAHFEKYYANKEFTLKKCVKLSQSLNCNICKQIGCEKVPTFCYVRLLTDCSQNCWRRWGSSLPCLRRCDTPLSRP